VKRDFAALPVAAIQECAELDKELKRKFTVCKTSRFNPAFGQ
jgi:hypothetical protein